MIARQIVLGPEFDAIPDDTEETLVGSAGHQEAIVTTYDGVQICAKRRDLPWFVGNQLILLIPREGQPQPRRIAPDVMVYRSLAATDPTTIAVTEHGPPALTIEIASPSTALQNDINLFDPNGKPNLYDQIGVEEYLVFDASGIWVRRQIWALRRGPTGFVEWEPAADGRWHSTLGISFAPQGTLLRVYDHDGQLVPRSVEFDTMLNAQARRLLDQSQQVASQAERLIEQEHRLIAQEDRLTEQERRLAALEEELRRLRGERP